MIVFIGSARNRQAVVFVLNVTPEQVVQGAQWMNFEISQRIAFERSTSVLEAHADSVHGLHKHSLLVPVRPDKFKHVWTVEPVGKRSPAESRPSLVKP